MFSAKHLELMPLGGVGEFGMNAMAYRWGSDAILVDAGMMFPGPHDLGVQSIVPDFSKLADFGRLHGVVLSHGHDDHIGAVPHLLGSSDVPIYSSAYTLGLLRHRMREQRRQGSLRLLPPGAVQQLGPFRVSTVPVSHSTPQSTMVVIDTPVGRIVHTADFRLAHGSPTFGQTNVVGLAELAREGVLALVSDSTNAEVPGTTPAESTVQATVQAILQRSRGRVVVSCFASNVERLAGVANACHRSGRKLLLLGAAMERHVELSEQLGLFRFPPQVRIDATRAAKLAPGDLVVVAAGSQGEPGSALDRLARGTHGELELQPGDCLIHSARVIPGNERVVRHCVNRLLDRGVEVVTAADEAVHVSGHAAAAELQQLVELLKPQYLLPVHGERWQLNAHAELAQERGFPASRIALMRSGQLWVVEPRHFQCTAETKAARVLLDETGHPVSAAALQERRQIAAQGVWMPVIALGGLRNDDRQVTGQLLVGLGQDAADDGLADQARKVLARLLSELEPQDRADPDRLQRRIGDDLRRALRRSSRCRPIVRPVVVEC